MTRLPVWLLPVIATGALAAAARADDELLSGRLSGYCVAAHRGGYWFADSNTRVRFENALADGADIVETDLQASSDGVPFLFHDELLDGTTGCRGPIAKTSARQVEGCRLNGLSHGPERFESALQWSHGRVVIDAEFKSLAVVHPAIDLVRRYGAYEWVYFQVGDGLELYRAARAYDPYVALEAAPAGPGGQRLLEELLSYRDPRLVSIQLHGDLLSSENVALIHEHATRVAVDAFRLALEWRWGIWPFRRVAACSRLFSEGVDIAVSNVPASCARQRDSAMALRGAGRIKLSDVPEAVVDAVVARYPGARLTGFERERSGGESTFEVGLAGPDRKLEVILSRAGQILAEELPMTAGDLPPRVRSALAASKYGSSSLRRVERVVAVGRRVAPAYELQLAAAGGGYTEIVMDAKGAITREEPKRAGEDDE